MILATLICTLGCLQQFQAPQAKTELVASTKAVQAGKPFEVALHMSMAPGWHSYYLNPGESGQATSITWHLPVGFKAGPIQWPVPERLVVAGVVGYVYEHEAWLVAEITPPHALPNDEPVKLVADASWLLCREACIPQKSKLTLSLPVGRLTATPSEFAQILDALPKPTLGLNFKATAQAKQAILSLNEPGAIPNGVEFYPADATYFGADLAQAKSTATGINITVPLSRYAPGLPNRVTGILVLPSGASKGVHWIDVQVTKR